MLKTIPFKTKFQLRAPLQDEASIFGNNAGVGPYHFIYTIMCFSGAVMVVR